MDLSVPQSPDAKVGLADLEERVAQQVFICTGFLLPDVWFPRTVVLEIGRRIGIADEPVGAAAVQRLIANNWLRASPNDRWLKLTTTDELRAEWELLPAPRREPARQLVQDVLLRLAYDLQATTDDETLALVLRQLVHLARIAFAASDPHLIAMLVGIGSGFERLGMYPEARTAYGDAMTALGKRSEALAGSR